MNSNAPSITSESVLLHTTDALKKVKSQLSNDESQSVKKTLEELFPEQEYQEKQIKRTKEILGGLANEFTEIQLQGVVTEVQYLAGSWLDGFEREIFDGLTLKELLHEKGGT